MADKKKKKQTAKQTTKRASSAKKPAAKKAAKPKAKPVAKSTAKKPAAPKKPAVMKPKAIKAAKGKPLMHDVNYENSTDDFDKIIILRKGKRTQKPQRQKKELRRITSVGGYTAWDGRTGKTFATEKEARDYAIDFFKRTGEIIPVTHTNRTVSHTFKAESKTDK